MDLQFDTTPVLPPPDQSTNDSSTSGQPIGAPGIPIPTGDKTVGGSTSGVNASKGASTAVGANPLIVDQNVQSALSSSSVSGMGMDAASVLGGAPSPIDPQTMIESLGTVATDLDQINSVINSFSSDVSALSGSASPEGKIRGSEGPGGSQKGERRDAGKKIEGKDGKGKGKSKAEGTSPSAEVTTTTSPQSVTSTGGVSQTTTTSMSTSTSSSQDSTTDSTASPDVISFTEIMDEIGGLDSTESETLAQQQASQISETELQAQDTMNQAASILQGADMMALMAGIGVGVSMATTAYGLGGVGAASKEGDQAEMESMDEQQAKLESSMSASSRDTDHAIENPTQEHITTAERSIHQTKDLAKEQQSKGIITKKQQQSINEQADAQLAAVRSAKSDPEAAKTSQSKAQTIAAARPKSVSFSQLAKQGIKPGETVSEGQAKEYIRATRTPEAEARINAGRAAAKEKGPNDLATFDKQQAASDDREAATFQESVKSLKTNRHTQAWQNAYSNKFQKNQLYAGTGMAVSTLFSQGLANLEDQMHQAQATRDSAGSQVASSSEQAMGQGVSQTEQVAEQLRQNQTNVAQDMLQAVSATKV